MQPLIKWTGSKRYLRDTIAGLVPAHCTRLIDPFCGGASYAPTVLEDTNVSKAVLSDSMPYLIDMWRLWQDDPEGMLSHYTDLWNALKEDDEIYYETRSKFNKIHDPKDFFFLNRTCYNGLVRFNSDKEFNVSYHFRRRGAKPKNMRKYYERYWKDVLEVVRFERRDYQDSLSDIKKDDFVFLDPPYPDSQMYLFDAREFDYSDFWGYIERLNDIGCSWVMTLNSNYTDDIVPDDLYLFRGNGRKTIGGFRNLKSKEKGDHVRVKERIYTNFELE